MNANAISSRQAVTRAIAAPLHPQAAPAKFAPEQEQLGLQVFAACTSGAWPASIDKDTATTFSDLHRQGLLKDARHVAAILSAVKSGGVSLRVVHASLIGNAPTQRMEPNYQAHVRVTPRRAAPMQSTEITKATASTRSRLPTATPVRVAAPARGWSTQTQASTQTQVQRQVTTRHRVQVIPLQRFTRREIRSTELGTVITFRTHVAQQHQGQVRALLQGDGSFKTKAVVTGVRAVLPSARQAAVAAVKRVRAMANIAKALGRFDPGHGTFGHEITRSCVERAMALGQASSTQVKLSIPTASRAQALSELGERIDRVASKHQVQAVDQSGRSLPATATGHDMAQVISGGGKLTIRFHKEVSAAERAQVAADIFTVPSTRAQVEIKGSRQAIADERSQRSSTPFAMVLDPERIVTEALADMKYRHAASPLPNWWKAYGASIPIADTQGHPGLRIASPHLTNRAKAAVAFLAVGDDQGHGEQDDYKSLRAANYLGHQRAQQRPPPVAKPAKGNNEMRQIEVRLTLDEHLDRLEQASRAR